VAGLEEAWCNFYAAVGTGIVERTDAGISVIQSNTCAAILAGSASAGVGRGKLTESTNKVFSTVAVKVGNTVHTHAAILTYDIYAVIEVSLATIPGEPISTETEDSTRIFHAQSSILTR